MVPSLSCNAEQPGGARRPTPGSFHIRCISGRRRLSFKCDRLYTVGRGRLLCDIVFPAPTVSLRHCQLFLDALHGGSLWISDGFLLPRASDLANVRRRFRSQVPPARPSLNGVFVNGRRIEAGAVLQLNTGDRVFLGCRGCTSLCGFVVEEVVATASYARQLFDEKPRRKRHMEVESRAESLLRRCKDIMRASDPISFLSESLKGDKSSSAPAAPPPICLNKDENCEHCPNPGSSFLLNRLSLVSNSVAHQEDCVSLPDLLYPVGTLKGLFIATFTNDIPWFLSYCQLPNHLPITIACHNAERCWSSSHESRSSAPFSNYPNLSIIYPPFPDIIAFGNDKRKKGVACHHPKLFVLLREKSLRVVVTSANLCSKQWNNVTNTVWCQDFPRREFPDCSSLFCTSETSDFAAQLASFIASLIIDVPDQAHWIIELAKYNFQGAAGHLVASVPGIHLNDPLYPVPDHCLLAKQTVHLQKTNAKFIGSVQASVVGLNHRFHAKADSRGSQLKLLASFLTKCEVDSSGVIEVLLKRNIDIPADANAISVLVADLDEHSEGDCMQLGFLPRDVAKWVAPLSDIDLFGFSAFIYPREALSAALGESSTKVQLILYVSQGPRFLKMSKLIQPAHISALSSLLATMQRPSGLWRLQEVLSRYKWPESLESDFVYCSSSIGTSINPQFLAAFSAAVGKKSFQFSESEESDPEWGCWNMNHELRNPSIKILFPTIKRVADNVCGILSSRRMLSFSEKTWQRLRSADIFHDAIPYPPHREGYPMHVKVAFRRFQSKTNSPSFGWIYCGSHNFSPTAWGHVINYHSSKVACHGLRICNYELGVVLITPPSDCSTEIDRKGINLHEMHLPFVTPAPKYTTSDRPATALAMRETLAEAAVQQKEVSLTTAAAEEDTEGDDAPEEEDMFDEAAECIMEEKEEEKIYAEMLWSQVDSCDS